MNLCIERAGHSSIQDAGRFGYERFGVSTAGAMDRLSLAQANALVGLQPDAAAIEIGPLPFSVSVNAPRAVIAVCGASRRISCATERRPFAQSFKVFAGDHVKLSAATDGMFSYLSVDGGLCVDKQLGSASLDARAQLGRPFARALADGDEIHINASDVTISPHRKLQDNFPTCAPIRVVLGPQLDFFPSATIDDFLENTWTVSTRADRTAYTLTGPKLNHVRGHDIVSEAVIPGSIQVPGSGRPLVLMPDCGTTGGYPKIATVIEADLRRLAQSRFQDSIRFEAINIETAEALSREFLNTLDDIPTKLVAEHHLDHVQLHAALAGANVAGDAFDATNSVP